MSTSLMLPLLRYHLDTLRGWQWWLSSKSPLRLPLLVPSPLHLQEA